MTAHGDNCDCPGCRNFRAGMDWAQAIRPSYVQDALDRATSPADDSNGDQS